MPNTLLSKYVRAHNFLALTLGQRHFIKDFNKFCPSVRGRALIYHKTTPFTPFFWDDYSHTNNWEIYSQAKILNQLGYTVDILDRHLPANLSIPDNYDIFIGLGLDGSGQHYTLIAQQLPSALKILYAATSNPDERNANLRRRYDAFFNRRHHRLPVRRSINHINMPLTMSLTDQIFCVGGHSTAATFSSYRKPLNRIFLSTSPHLTISPNCFNNSNVNRFLFFAGAGNILKGLDLAFEAFASHPNLHLYVCTQLEPDFVASYQSLLAKSPNIHLIGFIPVRSKLFEHLTNTCRFVILPSCTEGCPTSVTTCMRRGLIPVVTTATGLDVTDFGFTISDGTVAGVTQALVDTQSTSPQQLSTLTRRVISQSYLYTQQSYQASFTRVLLSVLSRL